MDITELILDDHREQRRLFAILEQIDRTETEVLSAIWDRLAAFLELHAKAEEEIFYPELLQVGIAARRADRVEDETLDAIHDHNEIRDAVAEVAQHQVGTDDWYAAVAAANLANSDHMAEEEREGLTDFRRLAGLSRRHRLAVAFAAYEARNYAGVEAVDEDPAGYIREVEKKLPTKTKPANESEPSTEDQPPATENKPTPSNGSLSVGSLKRN
ncbi:hemerythrin domain-containing protein [Nocardia sp. CS682]|uniref:hemerythrin domain-containing protein n=1 Tax=Nocardia sp. CS682 TaxID=1047172 RepID=UPI0010754719|nr:hemerythrin domain-containing protein [Nocardia sp. CS682]QBS38838.1 cation-binding protein [Nocardia sp. CS682]